MKCKINLDELKENSSKLINYSKVDITEKINEISNTIQTIQWSGRAHDKYIDDFNNTINEIRKLHDKINLFGQFLSLVHDEYSDIKQEMDKSWNNYLDEMEIEDEM